MNRYPSDIKNGCLFLYKGLYLSNYHLCVKTHHLRGKELLSERLVYLDISSLYIQISNPEIDLVFI